MEQVSQNGVLRTVYQIKLDAETLKNPHIAGKWWLVSESNQGHEDFQSSALPTELTSHNLFNFTLVGRAEPALTNL